MKQYSTNELLIRKYHKDVRRFKKECEKNNLSYRTFDTANITDICVLSNSEYDIGEPRHNLHKDNESYFLNEEDYIIWCNYEIFS